MPKMLHPESDEPSTRPFSPEHPSGDHTPEEDAGLLTEKPKETDPHSPPRQRSLRTWTEMGLFAWAVVATLFVALLAAPYEHAWRKNHTPKIPGGKRNLIFMVSDGMGPTSLSLTRSFRQYAENIPYNETLVLDNYIVGQSRTRSSSSLITDSAAGATAFSCGSKSYNGAISVLPDHTPCATVLEAAKQAGYQTGLVVTTRITDATPACFAAHVNKRDEEDLIAAQLLGETPLGLTVDLMLGAGRCHFLPNTSSSSCRADDTDLLVRAKDKGFKYLSNHKELQSLEESRDSLPLLGLFAPHDIPYEIDRRFPEENETYPALAVMAQKALNILSDATARSEKGFFLMIEGSRIDHAGHANDPAAQVHEVLAYDAAFKTVLNFLSSEKRKGKRGSNGILVATSDHETGGVATAKQLREYEYPEYLWHPSGVANASRSVEWVTQEYGNFLRGNESASKTDGNDEDSVTTSQSRQSIVDYLRTTLAEYLGIQNATQAEMDLLITRPRFAAYHFADMISRRSQTGWTTHGHSGADVNIYASDPATADNLQGSVENTEVGVFLREYLGVGGSDMRKVDEKLREEWSEKKEWMGSVPEEGERLDGQSHEVKMGQRYDEVFGR